MIARLSELETDKLSYSSDCSGRRHTPRNDESRSQVQIQRKVRFAEHVSVLNIQEKAPSRTHQSPATSSESLFRSLDTIFRNSIMSRSHGICTERNNGFAFWTRERKCLFLSDSFISARKEEKPPGQAIELGTLKASEKTSNEISQRDDHEENHSGRSHCARQLYQNHCTDSVYKVTAVPGTPPLIFPSFFSFFFCVNTFLLIRPLRTDAGCC